MSTESLTSREWLPGEPLNGSERRRPSWFLDVKYLSSSFKMHLKICFSIDDFHKMTFLRPLHVHPSYAALYENCKNTTRMLPYMKTHELSFHSLKSLLAIVMVDSWGSQALNRLHRSDLNDSSMGTWNWKEHTVFMELTNWKTSKKEHLKKNKTFESISNQTIGVTLNDKGMCISNLTHIPTPAQEPGYEANVECIPISYTNFVFLELKLNLEYWNILAITWSVVSFNSQALPCRTIPTPLHSAASRWATQSWRPLHLLSSGLEQSSGTQPSTVSLQARGLASSPSDLQSTQQ